MAETTITLARTGAAIISQAEPSNHIAFSDGAVITNEANAQRILLAQFDGLPSAYRYNKLVKAWLGGGVDPQIYEVNLAVYKAGAANLNTVTWHSRPAIDSTTIGAIYISKSSQKGFNVARPLPKGPWPYAGAVTPPAYTAQQASAAAKEMLTSPTLAIGCMPTSTYTVNPAAYREGAGTYPYTPFVLNVVIDTAVTISNNVAAKPGAPTSGYLDPYVSHEFSWEFVSADDVYTCYGGWTQASATFYYRNGNSGAFTSRSAGTADHVTLQPSAFGRGVFQWYVTATDTNGRTTTSPTYILSTADSLSTCTAIAPVDTVEDGSKPIVFEWSVSTDTGTTPTAADLQISADGSTWSTLGNVSGSATTWSASPNTISAGNQFWRVRSYNADGVAGSWSSAASFVCISAEAAPVVTCDGKPFAEIRWQAGNQQAYRVTVDGVLYGPYFGTAKTFSIPDYLEDGGHTVSVEIQNSFGLWSSPGSTSFTVTNVPGSAITLSGMLDRDAELSWVTADTTRDFLIYRDGIRIGHTSGTDFSDRTVLGYHEWQVINRRANGYYTASNAVAGTLMVTTIAIAELTNGAWIELKKSSQTDRSFEWNQTQNVSLRQMAGQIYPDIETSPYRSQSVTFSVAWTYDEADQAEAFAALIGRPVILKTPCEGAMVGSLAGWQRANNQFYRDYTCTVQRIHWRDYVDADD